MSAGQIYFSLEQKIGDLIDWYNVQFYSQGNLYTTCDGLLTNSGGPFPQTSLFELVAGGIPQEKLVIGKPALLRDVESFAVRRSMEDSGLPSRRAATPTPASVNTNGFVDPSVLSQCLVTAVAKGWNAGVMVWEVRINLHYR